MATRQQLLGYRKDLTDLRHARETLTRMELDNAQVEREIQKLTDWIVPVDVPCLLCRKLVPVPAQVDDPRGDVPSKCICESCDALTTT